MKLTLVFLLVILTLSSCSNTINNRHWLIKPAYTHSETNIVYSELVIKSSDPIDNKTFLNNNRDKDIHVKIRILRTSPLNSKQIRQSAHDLSAKLKAGSKYHVSTSVEDEMLNVWLTNSVTLEVVSTVSTINTVFEKVFTLKEETKDEAYRIKIILNSLQDKIEHVRIINKRKPRYAWDE